MSCSNVLGLAFGVAIILATAATYGILQLPLPAPAHNKYAQLVPHYTLFSAAGLLQGDFKPNNRLAKSVVRVFDGQIVGAESVTIGPDGQLVMLDRYNQLYEAWPDETVPGGYKLKTQPRAKLGAGRPLGYHFDHEGNLIVCDSLKGLIKFDYTSGAITILATHVSVSSPLDPGTEITYSNDLAIAADGTIYFTSCTDIVPPLNHLGFYDTYRAWFLGLMQGTPNGRLLKYDPATRETHVIAKGFYYANGVALSPDDSFVVMAETDRLRAHKIWVKGAKTGTIELLIDHLPGVPDGVDAALDGSFWVSLVAPAPPFESKLLTRFLHSPFVRALYAWLPVGARPGLKAWGAVVKVNSNGQVTEFLVDLAGEKVSTISAVSEVRAGSESGTRLFLGNLVGPYLSYIDLP